jgi:type I pantothenate kinase
VARYEELERAEWAARLVGAVGAGPLLPPDVAVVDGEVSRRDLVDVYCPLGALISERARGDADRPGPFLVSVVGSVAVGKSTSARALRTALMFAPPGCRVDVVATDGFLLSNRELARAGLSERKGFPESFDHEALSRFLDAVQSGAPEVHAPVYSHEVYDVIDETQVVARPDVLIVEGMPLANDRVDVSVYLDAAESDIEQWFVERFLLLRAEALDDDASFFRHFTSYTPEQAVAIARDVWTSINAVNLREHILPAREECDVILEKGADHSVQRVRVRTS